MGRIVFSQLMDFIPKYEFNKCIQHYHGNRKVKTFYGTSQNAVKTQIWISIAVYVLVAIIKKKLNLKQSLSEILQILSISLFERTLILQVFTNCYLQQETDDSYLQLDLFNL